METNTIGYPNLGYIPSSCGSILLSNLYKKLPQHLILDLCMSSTFRVFHYATKTSYWKEKQCFFDTSQN